MRTTRNVMVLLLAIPMLAIRGDEPAAPLPEAVPMFVLPMRSQQAASVVQKTEVIDAIKPGVWYVIRSKVPFFVLDSPQGSVSIISGPSSVDGIFADGDGKSETRVFDPKESTYLIQGLKECKTELILIPVGVTDRSTIQRQILTVGAGPQPPPNPPPDVEPPPVDPPDEKARSFRVIFVKESGATLSVKQSSIPDAAAIREYLNANATQTGGRAGWRLYDPDDELTNEDPTFTALWAAVKPKLVPAPCMVIEKNGHATVMAFPADVDDCLAVLKKARGE